jgi:hypothetical protein
MKYTLHKLEDENGATFYCILEQATQQVVDAYIRHQDANKRFKFLNHGGAFDGFTPAFVLKKFTITNTAEE